MDPYSIPADPAQPNTMSYSFQALELFERFTRQSYLLKFGVQAPAYDPTRRIKSWFDTSLGAGGPYLIAVTDASHVTNVRRLTMEVTEASTVNLAGSYDYPVWDPPAVKGYWSEPQFPNDRHAIDRFTVCTFPEAQALTGEIGQLETAMGRLGGPEDAAQHLRTSEDTTFAYSYDPDETRRVFVMTFPSGAKLFCGQLLKWKYAFGVGAPGKWADPTGHQPVWVHDVGPQLLPDIRPEREVPIRVLKENERIVDTPFGPSVFRTDLMPADNSGAGLSSDQARQLSSISDTVNAIERQISQLVPQT